MVKQYQPVRLKKQTYNNLKDFQFTARLPSLNAAVSKLLEGKRKGFIFDQITVYAILFGMAFWIIMSFTMGGEIPETAGETNFTEMKDIMTSVGNTGDSLIPYVTLVFMALPTLFSFMVNVHPIFLILSVIGTAVNVFFGWVFQQVFLYLAGVPAIAVYAESASNTITIFENLPLIGFAFGIFNLVVMIFKFGSR